MGTSKKNILIVLYVLMIFCAFGIIASVIVYERNNTHYVAGKEEYQSLADEVFINTDTEAAKIFEQTVLQADQEPSFSLPDRIDFDRLMEQNKDTAAWITDGYQINYPIVQGSDNEFYLNHLFSGEVSKVGCIFMDYRNESDFSDKNTVLYGHNMQDGSMFETLMNYKEQEYYETHPTLYLYTPAGDYTVELFAGVVVEDSPFIIQLRFSDSQEYLDYINAARTGSTFDSDEVLTENDQIVTLATCTYETGNARYLLFGRLVETK
ncbi:MAG: class B sortase [Lachnospiraceae bacterium]